jgi:hypothetical protein
MRKLLVLVPLVAAICAAFALSATSAAAHGARAAARQTVGRIVHPVHANGTPVAGYTVHRQHIAGFTCTTVSPVAVDDGIASCSPDAAYAVACWKSTHHTVLCLRNPRTKVLARIRYTGRFHAGKALDRPSPQALVLFGGTYCEIRDGGAWGSVKGHPHWFGDYSCNNGADVYGRGRDGIVRSTEPWQVHMVRFHNNGTQTIRTREVRLAYYVGTAN